MFRKGAVHFSILALAVSALFANGHRGGLAQSQAQSVPNLNGTWELVEVDGTKKNSLGPEFPRLTLVISQEGSQIKVTQKRVRRGVETVSEYSYYADGRGETNNGRIEVWSQDLPRFMSVTGWQKDKLLTEYDSLVQILTGSSSSTVKGSSVYSTRDTAVRRQDEWRLASDGKTLVLTSSTVQMHSSLAGGHATSPGDLRAGGSDQDQIAPRASFSKNKLVFRRR